MGLVLVAMTIYGVHPGLTMLGRDLDITVSIIVTLALGNLFVTLLGMVATGQLAKLTLIPFPLLAAVLLPVTFVAAFLNTFHWGDIITVCAMFALGMSMKWLGWPRPPLLLGFILGPIIEQNLWPSVQLWGWGFVSRPLTIALVVAAVISVAYLTRALSKAELAESPVAAPSVDRGKEIAFTVTEQGPLGTAAFNIARGSILSRLRWPVLKYIWRWDAVFSMAILAVVVWFFFEAQTFRHPEGRFLPTCLGIALAPLLALQITGRLFASGQQGAIMDLGMRTGTSWESVRKLAAVLAWLAGFIFAIGVIGMPIAAVGFATIFGLTQVKLRGQQRAWGLLPGVIMAALIYLVFENLMVIEWPSRVALEWMRF